MKNKFSMNRINGQNVFLISDYQWWNTNEPDIYEWMDQHLPRGRNHQQGITITFDTDRDMTLFLLRWGT